MRRARSAATGLVLAASALGAGAQSNAALTGIVRDSAGGFPVIGVQLSIEGTSMRAISDDRGAFRFFPVPVTGVRLAARRLGFRPRSLTVVPGEPVELRLAPAALALGPVIVNAERGHYTGRLAGYYERLERRTQGQFITREDLEREKPTQLTDMLQRSPGIRITRGRPGAQSVRMRGRDCRPLVWIDGAALAATDVDLDSFSPASLEGIEMYLSATSTPGRFLGARGQSECGTILLWTRGTDTEPRPIPAAELARLEAQLDARQVFTGDEVDVPAAVAGGGPWLVAYPPALRASGTSGLVVAEFVVDTRGMVEEGTFGIVSSPDARFSDAVREAVEAARFTPARRAGQAVRQLVRQPFTFQSPAHRGESGEHS